MAYGLNVFTGKLDLMGGGAAVISSAVATPADLPITLGTPAVGVTYLAQSASGTWFVNYRPAGLYRRTANVGTAADWQYLGAFPEANRDDRFRIYNSADTTKQVAFDVSGISTGTTRTLTVPNASGTIATEEGMKSLPAGSLWDATKAREGASADDGQLFIIGNSVSGFGGIISANSLTADRTYTLPDASGTVMLGSLNLASLTNTATARTNLGLGTGDSPTFLNIALARGTITTSSPVTLTQTWNASGVTFTALDVNVTNTASAAASILANIRVDGTTRFSARMNGEWGSTDAGIGVRGTGSFNRLYFYSQGTIRGHFNGDNFAIPDLGAFAWSSSGAPSSLSFDLLLRRAAAGTLAQYNGTNAQAFRLYGTFTDTSNGRWLEMGSTTAGVFSIRPTGNGTGASGNVLHISGLPTSNPGPGILWNNAGSVAIGT